MTPPKLIIMGWRLVMRRSSALARPSWAGTAGEEP